MNYQELLKETVVNILDSYGDENTKERTTLLGSDIGGGDQSGQKERVERVRSMIAPRSYATPEKLILEAEEVNGVEPMSEWMAKHFPAGSSLVTVPRGDKGFGIIMVEGKVCVCVPTYVCVCMNMCS